MICQRHRTFSASLLRGRASLRLQLDPDALWVPKSLPALIQAQRPGSSL